jgi:hypothetical protein
MQFPGLVVKIVGALAAIGGKCVIRINIQITTLTECNLPFLADRFRILIHGFSRGSFWGIGVEGDFLVVDWFIRCHGSVATFFKKRKRNGEARVLALCYLRAIGTLVRFGYKCSEFNSAEVEKMMRYTHVNNCAC